MSPVTSVINFFKQFKRHLRLCLFFVFPLFFHSCTANNTDTGEYSRQFKAIGDTIDNFKDLKKRPLIGTNYLDSAFKHIGHPFVHDKFRFYGYHYLYQLKQEHDYKKALLYADSMLMMAKQSVTKRRYQLDYAEANFALGDAYFAMFEYADAYKCFYQGYYIGKSQVNNEILAEYTYRIGMVLFKQAHYLEAANYFKISHDKSSAYKDDFRSFYQRQELLADIGESYKNAGETDSASYYLKKAIDYINANNQRFSNVAEMLEIARGVVYGDQGDVAFIKHDYIEAESFLKKSIAINLKKGNDNKDAQLTEIKLGRLYLVSNRSEELLGLLQSLRTQLDSIPNAEAEINWSYLMAGYYENKDDAKALAYFKKYSALKDSAVKQANSLKSINVTTQQANYEKQTEIDNLKDYSKRQLIYIYLAVLLAIMAAIIVFLVFRNLKRSRRDVVAIKALNDKISHQKENLEHTLAELNQSGREKDRILRAVAHDLRNPLGGIASLSSVMAEEEYTAEQLDMINLIKETSFNSLELINEILEVANTANVTFNKDWVDVNSLISNSVELMRFKAADKQQSINLALPPDSVSIFINREKIWRVISNLISNAIKFSNNGGEINVCVKNEESWVQVAVKDNGIGIPDKLKQGVFNMFTDAKRPGTEGEKSFGLGLSICQQIIGMHDGKIWFESDTESGTTFYFSLPR